VQVLKDKWLDVGLSGKPVQVGLSHSKLEEGD
jgi:hypothetical protein